MVYAVAAVSLFWFSISFLALRNVLAAPKLPKAAELPATANSPHVTVVIACRDEGKRIEETLRGLLQQVGVDLEIVVVDDRSTDETPAILRRLKTEYERLRTVRVDELPPGWLGKCHACHQGVAHSSSPWLLFSDGDIHMVPDLIARAVATAEREGAAHLTLWPGLNCSGAMVRGAVLAWGQCLAIYAPAAEINRDRGKKGLGVGAFNLVRREAYDAIGGHRTLAMEVVDDVKLGMLVRRAGFRQRVYGGSVEVEAEWAHTVGELIRVVEKNWFAGMNYNVAAAVGTILLFIGFWIAALLMPLVAPNWGLIAVAALLSPIIPGLVQARQLHWPWYVALLTPIGYLMFAAAGINSVWKTLRQGGVRWRDTFYPLAELRAGMVR